MSQGMITFRTGAPLTIATLATVAGCWNSGQRWEFDDQPAPQPVCVAGDTRCTPVAYERCEKSVQGVSWVVQDYCYDKGLVCVKSLQGCAECNPGGHGGKGVA